VPCALLAAWVNECIVVEAVRDEIPRQRRWRPAAALAVLVAVTATVGVLIAVLQRPPTHAPIRPTPIPTSIPTLTPTATEAPPDLSGTWLGLCSGSNNGGCTLTLTRTATGFDGMFMLPSPPGKPFHVSGNLIGSAVTLRGAGVVFTGTLSGSTMSGSYTDIANGKTYSWSVTLSA
jgi:hypothetical protein